MKKPVILLIFFLLVAAFGTKSFASEKTASTNTRQVTGNVTAIDMSNNTVTVEKKNKTITLNFEEKTRVIQCTEKPAITDIKIGDKVTAKYKETAGKNIAKSITVQEITDKSD